jgi:hypothetical protein
MHKLKFKQTSDSYRYCYEALANLADNGVKKKRILSDL